MEKISEPIADLIFQGKKIKSVALSKAQVVAQKLANQLRGPVSVRLRAASKKAAIELAEQAYRNFHGAEPNEIRSVRIDRPEKTGYKLGNMVGVAYEAERDGKTHTFYHEFRKSARPELIVDASGKRAHIVGGRYKVTDRGFIDEKDK